MIRNCVSSDLVLQAKFFFFPIALKYFYFYFLYIRFKCFFFVFFISVSGILLCGNNSGLHILIN